MRRRGAFIEPFLIACNTRNAKFAGSGVTSLQRLIISKGLPKSRLTEALDAFNACTELGLEVQLKILQALPSLVQNYAEDLKGDLLAGALKVCSSLQSAKVQTVSGVATATLQQLVTAVFEKVTAEDRNAASIPVIEHVPGDGETIPLRPAAFDAYRVFRDLVLTAEDRQTKFVQFSSLSPESSLELIWSSMSANAKLFDAHAEFRSVIQSNLLPLITRPLVDRLPFPITVRSLRLLDFLLGRYLTRFPGEFEVALGLIPQNLDENRPQWKRALVMEVVRGIFAKGSLVVEAYAVFDSGGGGKLVIQDLLSGFVRLSSEKPTLIGLGHQSTTPTGPSVPSGESAADQATLEATVGMAGVLSSALGAAENNVTGISSQWSLPRAACLDQLDKTDAPQVPDTYVYALVLECLGLLSEALARMILPLTVRTDDFRPSNADGQNRKEGADYHSERAFQLRRSQSFRERAVPLNPMEAESVSTKECVFAVANLVDHCWPAVLATSSTFLNAALEDQYYRNLIKAFQRFAQVAGLLRLKTPRDALMTTLSKSAVPPHILNAAMADPAKSPSTEHSTYRVVSSQKSLLSVDSLVSQASSLSLDRDRRSTAESSRVMLTTRNLLCLRALLNLAIALGPTLDRSLAVVVDALRQADIILSAIPPQQVIRQSTKAAESPAAVQAFSGEIAAVEAAASRLLESTADYPNDAFTNVINTFCHLLSGRPGTGVITLPQSEHGSPPPTPITQRRTLSGLPGLSTFAELQIRDYQFVIPKLGSLAGLNVSRFIMNDPEESGWLLVVDMLVRVASHASHPREARQAATAVVCQMVAEMIAEVAEEEADSRTVIQRRALGVLLRLVEHIHDEDRERSNTDAEIYGRVLDALRSILERCGDSIIAGWNKVVAVISSSFERVEGIAPQPTHLGTHTAVKSLKGADDDVDTSIDWTHVSHDFVSVQVGRAAFAATQLVCSDFLASLPVAVVVSLIELLERFITQTDDLNLALTTVTTAWNLSDFLFNNSSAFELDTFSKRTEDFDTVEDAVTESALVSRPAQTLLLLLRLRHASRSSRKDVRNAVFQTICSIFRSHGQQLSPATWDVILRRVLLRMVSDDARLYLKDQKPDQSADKIPQTDEDMSRTMIASTADVIAQHMRIIEQIAKLPSLWEVFLCTMESYLDAERHTINAAVYSSLSNVLSHIDHKTAVWTAPCYRTVALWLKRVPDVAEDAPKGSNQDSFNAYISTAAELYRLTKESMGTSQLRKLLDNLLLCVQQSDGPRNGGDIKMMSMLQTKVLDLLKSVRTDMDMIPSHLIIIAAQFCLLHHESGDMRKGPTYLALASESVNWLQALVMVHNKKSEIWESGALVAAVQSLRRLITAKYERQSEHKGQVLWRRGTLAALTLSKKVLAPVNGSIFLDAETRATLWSEYVMICSGIVGAKGIGDMDDDLKIHEDQLFDITSFHTLRAVLTPALGNASLPYEVRDQYCRALFEASLVHTLETSELPEPGISVLKTVQKIRRGRVKSIRPNKRERMCYLCFAELAALASATASNGAETELDHLHLAQAAAPLLVFRLATPIRAYIADQPLRGRRPQPLSEFEELMYCLEQIKSLNLHIDALAAPEESPGYRTHLQYLYPLLIQAAATAGDKWGGNEEIQRAVLEVLRSGLLYVP